MFRLSTYTLKENRATFFLPCIQRGCELWFCQAVNYYRWLVINVINVILLNFFFHVCDILPSIQFELDFFYVGCYAEYSAFG